MRNTTLFRSYEFRIMESRRELGYHVASVVMQTLWMFALWLVLGALRISRVSVAVVIATIFLSGFAIVNTFYVWPKLLSAAYTLGFAAPIFAARSRRLLKKSWTPRLLPGFLLACGLLAHGGVIFALPGILFIAFLRYGKRMLRETCVLAMVAFAFYSPWMAYQKFVDPPGDRLLKMHLTGAEQVTHEPFLKLLVDAYRRQTPAEWVAAKAKNMDAVFGHEIEYLSEAPGLLRADLRAELRLLEFFFLLPALSFSGFGIAGLLFRRFITKPRAGRELDAAEQMLICAFVMTVPWILVMFTAGATVVHQGAYAMVILAMTGSILAFRAVAPAAAIAVCAVHGFREDRKP